jgi:hypothetical protein
MCVGKLNAYKRLLKKKPHLFSANWPDRFLLQGQSCIRMPSASILIERRKEALL